MDGSKGAVVLMVELDTSEKAETITANSIFKPKTFFAGRLALVAMPTEFGELL